MTYSVCTYSVCVLCDTFIAAYFQRNCCSSCNIHFKVTNAKIKRKEKKTWQGGSYRVEEKK